MGEDGGADVSGIDTGLGNFKGVMLCNRPGAVPAKDSSGSRPFYSTVHPSSLEPVGMLDPKVRDLEPAPLAKRSPIVHKHRAWLKDLRKDFERRCQEQDATAAAEVVKFENVRENAAQQREDVAKVLHHASENKMTANDPDLVNNLMEALKPSTGPRKPSGKKKKPLWAMTEAEREAAEKDEEEDLLSFANNLDFDAYMDDFEFREALAALKGRASQIESTKFKKEMDAEVKKREPPPGLIKTAISNQLILFNVFSFLFSKIFLICNYQF